MRKDKVFIPLYLFLSRFKKHIFALLANIEETVSPVTSDRI